ncbi:MAG: DUF542 domain-containing protein [Myxococcales bacterium]|nr:DUF542 domain-containing protein [Myxococcales bacterium]
MNTSPLSLSLGELAARRPEAIEVLERFGLDYCCGGRRTVAEACAAGGVDAAAVEAALGAAPPVARSWAEAPLPDLIDHLLAAFHAPHREAFETLARMGARVVEAHGGHPTHGAGYREAFACFRLLAEELEAHMQKEERVLFPWIRAGRGPTAGEPVRVMLSEHDQTAALLARLRAAAFDYAPPVGACATARGFLAGLAGLERALHEHMHLENNVLFPRALAG